MEDSYTGLPTSHLLGSVPAVVDDGKSSTNYEVPEANMQTFPPNNGGDRGRGYQSLAGPSGMAGLSIFLCSTFGCSPLRNGRRVQAFYLSYRHELILANVLSTFLTETFEQQPSSNWRGVFSISSYTQYFNVDTDVVLNRFLGSLFPTGGDFSSMIDANPDLYGPIWISTTLIFVIAALGNCATYLMEKKSDTSTSWSFDVGYVNLAFWSIYGYVILVPLGFYFLLHYLGSNASLIRFWCMWGYSLFIFIPSCLLLLIPVEALRWIIILLVGGASACFVGSNLMSYTAGSDLTIVVVAAFLLQMALAIFLKVWFFP